MFFDRKVYIGCGLTHAPPEFRAEIEGFKINVKSFCTVLSFLGLGDFPPYEIYRYDIHDCVMRCCLMVAVCDHPATGLGYEMATQVEARGMPCLAIAREGSLVSDLIIDTRQPGFEFRRYRDLRTDGATLVADKLARMQKDDETQHPLFPEFVRGQSRMRLAV